MGKEYMTGSLRHPARERRALASIVVLLLVLAGCETTGIGGPSSAAENRAARMAGNAEHEAAADAYMGLAVDAVGTERDRYTLLAIEQYLDAGDVYRARNNFRNIARPTAGELEPLWITNRAALHLYSGESEQALELLESLSRRLLSRRDRLRVEALRADAWIQQQDPARAVELMTQRESWVEDRRGSSRIVSVSGRACWSAVRRCCGVRPRLRSTPKFEAGSRSAHLPRRRGNKA